MPSTLAPRRSRGPADERSLLKEQAYIELKRLIQAADFAPGEFLSERQLAARLGMSKTPVKAALERLEMEGFVAVSPQQGIVVRDISIQEVADQFEIRSTLESFVARSVAGKLNEPWIARIESNLEEQRQAVAKNKAARIVDTDAEFHLLLCECHGNQEVLRVMYHLRDKMHRLISRVVSQNPQRSAASLAEHEAIAAAIFAGDADLAAQEVVRHLEFGRQFLLQPRVLPRDVPVAKQRRKA